MRAVHPSGGKILAALFVASLVASLPGLIFVAAYPIALAITIAHSLLLGAPAYLLLRRYFAFDWGLALVVGIGTGLIPCSLILLWIYFQSDPEFSPLAFGPALLAFCAVMGATAGLVFRAMLGAPQVEQEIDPAIFE